MRGLKFSNYPSRTTAIFYYSGHGTKDGLENARKATNAVSQDSYGFVYGGLIDAAIPIAQRFALAVTGFAGHQGRGLIGRPHGLLDLVSGSLWPL